MLSESESAAILHYVAELRKLAWSDKICAAQSNLPKQRERWLAERRRRLIEALRWRRHEREYRKSAIMKELLRSQLRQSVPLETVE